MAQDIFSAVTGIPAIVLNFSSGMERSIYNNMSEADRRAVTSYLQPIWWHRDQVLTRRLLRDIDQDETHFIESDLSEVGALQEDQNAVWERHGAAYEKGGIKRGEYREAIGYKAAEDGSDDVYYVRPGATTVTPEQEETERERALEEPEPTEMIPSQQPTQLQGGQQPQQLRVASKSLPLKSNSRQIVIVGGPHTGKTTLAGRLKDELQIANVMHSTDDLIGLGWSEASTAAAKWFDQSGDWIIEGVSTARALRKWLAANPTQTLNAEILVLNEAFTPLLRGQESMTTGVHTVFREIEPELQRRGARIRKVKNANEAMRLFTVAA